MTNVGCHAFAQESATCVSWSCSVECGSFELVHEVAHCVALEWFQLLSLTFVLIGVVYVVYMVDRSVAVVA